MCVCVCIYLKHAGFTANSKARNLLTPLVYVCMCIYTYIHIYIYTHTCICVCMYICLPSTRRIQSKLLRTRLTPTPCIYMYEYV